MNDASEFEGALISPAGEIIRKDGITKRYSVAKTPGMGEEHIRNAIFAINGGEGEVRRVDGDDESKTSFGFNNWEGSSWVPGDGDFGGAEKEWEKRRPVHPELN